MTDHPGYPGQCCDTSPCTCQDAPLLDLDAIQARADAATDPSGCGSCRHHTDRGRAAIHEQCIARAQLIPAPDAPCYETILDTPEDQRANLPARFHTPVWDGNGTPNGWHCAVCWGDGWSTRWPCVTAATHGADVFTPEHLAERARTDVPALVAEIRRLRTELAGMTDLKDRALTKQDTIRAELEQYTALDLGAPDGRVSATCDNSEHPTWLRKPDDTRGCPWCELDQARQRNAAVLALLPDDPAEDINAPFVPLRRIRAAVTGGTVSAAAVATVCDAPHPIVEWSRCGRTPDHEGFHAADCGTWPRSRFPFGSSPS